MKKIDRLLKLTLRAVIALTITVPFAVGMLAAAYAERGYPAVGGEWLVIILIAGASWKLTGINKQREEREE